jgi:hypothetical protein
LYVQKAGGNMVAKYKMAELSGNGFFLCENQEEIPI